MANIKLDRAQLSMLTDFARQEMRERKKDVMDASDVHLGKCWVAALIRMAAHEKKQVLFLTETNVLEEIDV